MTAHTIDLRFVREPGILAWITDRATGGFVGATGPRWSHVGIVVRGADIRGFGVGDLDRSGLYEFGARDSVCGAVGGERGVQFRPYDYARFIDQETISVPVTSQEWLSFWALALKVRGAGYSRRSVEGFVEGENIADDPRRIRFDCSTLVAWLLLHTRGGLIPPELHGQLRQLSPNSLYIGALFMRFYQRDLAA